MGRKTSSKRSSPSLPRSSRRSFPSTRKTWLPSRPLLSTRGHLEQWPLPLNVCIRVSARRMLPAVRLAGYGVSSVDDDTRVLTPYQHNTTACTHRWCLMARVEDTLAPHAPAKVIKTLLLSSTRGTGSV